MSVVLTGELIVADFRFTLCTYLLHSDRQIVIS